MYTKASIFNLALGMLLLQRQITDTENDKSNEAKVLNTHYDAAFRSALEDMDLDSTSTQKVLALLATNPTDFPEWTYVYQYPTNCAFFRRIKSPQIMDNRASHIPKLIRLYNGQKAVFTNEQEAVAEIIPFDLALTTLSANAGLAIACRLAILSSPLVTGKGADRLKKNLMEQYEAYKAAAQEFDKNENFNFTDPAVDSEFVFDRLS